MQWCPAKRVTGFQGKRGRARAEMPNTSVPEEENEKKRVTAQNRFAKRGNRAPKTRLWGQAQYPKLPKRSRQVEAPNNPKLVQSVMVLHHVQESFGAVVEYP